MKHPGYMFFWTGTWPAEENPVFIGAWRDFKKPMQWEKLLSRQFLTSAIDRANRHFV